MKRGREGRGFTAQPLGTTDKVSFPIKSITMLRGGGEGGGGGCEG